MDEREQKGLMIAATKRIHRKGAEFLVPAASRTGKYTVNATAKTCSCPDYEIRQAPCKHIHAVSFYLQRQVETRPDGTTVVTEMKAVKVTYSQPWQAYNTAQTTEKEEFCRLLRELCSTIEEPEQRMGRPRVPLADGLFAACFKVYSTVSGRRFMTDMREAEEKGLVDHAPCYNSIFNVIESEQVTPIIKSLIEQSALPLAAVETDFAVDSTGIGLSRTFNYFSARYKQQQTGHAWLKLHAIVGTKTNVIAACEVTERDVHDSPMFTPLVERASRNFQISEVSADKAYSSRANLELVVNKGAAPFIPFKSNHRGDGSNELWNRLFHFYSFQRSTFAEHYHKRSNVEATFSALKRKFGDCVRSKTPVAQQNETLLKVLAHNIVCLVHSMHELGVNPSF